MSQVGRPTVSYYQDRFGRFGPLQKSDSRSCCREFKPPHRKWAALLCSFGTIPSLHHDRSRSLETFSIASTMPKFHAKIGHDQNLIEEHLS